MTLCNKVVRVSIDVDESEEWRCVKPLHHAEVHYVENADRSAGMAVPLTPEEIAYQKGLVDGARAPIEILTEWAAWLRRRSAELREQAMECQRAAEQIERKVRRITLRVGEEG